MIGASPTLNRLLDILACPDCKRKIVFTDNALFCESCRTRYAIMDGVPVMLSLRNSKDIEKDLHTAEGLSMESNYKNSNCLQRKSVLGKIKSCLTPPSSTLHIYYIEKMHKKKYRNLDSMSKEGLIVNIGGGPIRNSPEEINLNIGLYPNVDLVGDAHLLPFVDESVNGIVSGAVIEHLHDPAGSVKEIHRVLKSGGFVYAEIPFLQHFHGCPGDYQRYTLMGIEKLFSEFEKVDSGICVGPSSVLSQFLIDYLCLLIPMSYSRPINFLIRWIVSPLKYLDLFLIRKKDAYKIASGFYFYGRK